MHEVWLIARREYLERVRSRAFLMMTILFPLMVGLLIGGSVFAGKLSSGVKKIAIASNDAVLARAVAAEVQKEQANSASAKPPEVVAPASEAQRADLNRRVEDRTLDGYLWLEQKSGSTAPEVTFISRSSGDLFSLGGMESAVDHGLERKQLLEHGETDAEITAMARHTDIQTMQIREGRLVPSNSLKSFFGAYAMMFLIYFTVVFYGMNVARSVVEEKTSRIFEVLLSTVRPQSLMAGKLLGVGAAGLTQMAIWLVLISAVVARSASTAVGPDGLSAYGIHAQQLFFLAAYFLLGFFFYSAIAAAVGASVSSEQEIQQFSMVIVAPLTVGMVLITYITSNPTALPVVLLSLFPPCTPIVMFLRMSSQMPPAWQIALSMVLMLLSIWGAIWVASRIYRVGILMYGKRATLPEMLRWMRYS
ncbi:MAG TPA: ABC transporter permease [Acidobacteriaceae bacterium]|nr:ABC transporter permease [Acidobacteriaceae bacterium]